MTYRVVLKFHYDSTEEESSSNPGGMNIPFELGADTVTGWEVAGGDAIKQSQLSSHTSTVSFLALKARGSNLLRSGPLHCTLYDLGRPVDQRLLCTGLG